MDGLYPPMDQMMEAGDAEMDVAGLAMAMAGSLDLEPEYPAWLYRTDKDGNRKLKPPRKPTEAEFEDWATEDCNLHAQLLDRFLDDIRFYRGDNHGHWHDWDPTSDEEYCATEIPTQVNKMVSIVGGTPETIRFRGRTKAEEQDAQDLEDAVCWFLSEWKRQHRAAGNAELRADLSWYKGVYGRWVVRVLCDPWDDRFPWQIDLLDPATCFPHWGDKHGLLRVSRVYYDNLSRVLDAFDPDGSKNLARKFRTKSNLHADAGIHEVEVRDVTTRWHRYVSVDGTVIMLDEHRYGRVPYVFSFALGEAGGASAPRSTRQGLTRREIRAGLSSQTYSRQYDLIHRGVSFFHHVKPAIMQQEAVGSLLMTAAKKSVNPPLITTSPYKHPPSSVDQGPGGHTRRRPGETTEPADKSPRPMDAGPLLAMTKREIANGVLPDVLFGNVEGSNVTGFASDTLMAAAKDRIQPYFDSEEAGLADVVELALVLFRDHGHAYVGPTGELVVPRRDRFDLGRAQGPPQPPPWLGQFVQQLAAGAPGMGLPPLGAFASAQVSDDPPEVRLTREQIKRVGPRPEVKLINVGLQSRTLLANYLSMLVDKKLIRRRTAMEALPEVERPELEWRGILAEDGQVNPKMLELVEFPRALYESGDWDRFFAYLVTVLLPSYQQAMAPPAMPGMGGAQGGMAPPGLPGGTPPGPMTPQAPLGGSPAMLGQGPGSMGAPVGAPGGGGGAPSMGPGGVPAP